MTRFRSKPFEIEAVQLTKELAIAIQDSATPPPHGLSHRKGYFYCASRQGEVPAEYDDWIIQESDGSGCYPCKSDVFAVKYEPLTTNEVDEPTKIA